MKYDLMLIFVLCADNGRWARAMENFHEIAQRRTEKMSMRNQNKKLQWQFTIQIEHIELPRDVQQPRRHFLLVLILV